MRRTQGPNGFFFIIFLAFFLIGCEPASESSTTTAEAAAKTETDAASAQNVPENDCAMVMGWDPWEPYQYRNARGEMTGLDIEIARAAAKAGGCELTFVDGRWTDLLDRMKAGEIHLLAGATRTAGREAFAAFTDTYRSESFVVYTRADNEALRSATTFDALHESGARIGAVAEYYYGAELSAALDKVHAAGLLEEAAVAELNYSRLENGEIDAFVEDPFVATSVLRNRRQAERIVPTGIVANVSDVAFMLAREGMPASNIQKFQAGVAAIRDSGELDAITRRWREAR